MSIALYRGFSSFSCLSSKGKSFACTNQELVKRDLLNHIYTIPGERPMMSSFGTRIPLLAFEPLDKISLADVKEDLTTVVNYDPRVKLVDIAVIALPDNNAIVAVVDLIYVETGEKETLKLEFKTAS
jgi:phage baseplate assembly protein W